FRRSSARLSHTGQWWGPPKRRVRSRPFGAAIGMVPRGTKHPSTNIPAWTEIATPQRRSIARHPVGVARVLPYARPDPANTPAATGDAGSHVRVAVRPDGPFGRTEFGGSAPPGSIPRP